jgi:DNA-directed RNA polymerase specialized sigma24 family protein
VPVAPDELREFLSQRQRLFAIAYRMLGSASEAEDAIQDAYLRWDAADRTGVREPAAWLTRVLTTLCITRLTVGQRPPRELRRPGVLYLAIVLDVADGLVATIRIVTNPAKLSYLSAQLR